MYLPYGIFGEHTTSFGTCPYMTLKRTRKLNTNKLQSLIMINTNAGNLVSLQEQTIQKSPMIQLQNINKVYRTDTVETIAVNDISLTIDKGEFLSVMGPSGCGKSTLLNMIGLLDKPTKGTINIGGQIIQNLSDKELAKFRNQKLGFIFQSYHLINDLRVADNVELPLLYRTSSAKERKLDRKST